MSTKTNDYYYWTWMKLMCLLTWSKQMYLEPPTLGLVVLLAMHKHRVSRSYSLWPIARFIHGDIYAWITCTFTSEALWVYMFPFDLCAAGVIKESFWDDTLTLNIYWSSALDLNLCAIKGNSKIIDVFSFSSICVSKDALLLVAHYFSVTSNWKIYCES